jgi:HSP20 family protein
VLKREGAAMAIKHLVPRFGRGHEQAPARRGDVDPYRELQRDMNRLFEDFFEGFPLMPRWGESELALEGFTPRVDIAETEKDVKVSAELPGMDEKDIAVEMDEDALTIRGERREEQEEKGKRWYRRELSYGSFHRRIPLPASVEGAKATAKFKKGVLTVTVPKREAEHEKRKSIKIETA